MLVSKKSSTGTVIVAEEDGILTNQHGSFPFKVGEWMFKDLNGNVELVTKDFIEDHFVRVKVKKKAKVNLDEMMKNYSQSWVSDEDYIF